MKRALTEQEKKKLQKILTDDILERYNHPEYHDQFLIEDFYSELGIEMGRKK